MGTEKTWCGGMDCATGAGDICQCTEPCPCWQGFEVKVDVHQGSVLSPLLFIIELEAKSCEFRSGVPGPLCQ